jgi:restriction system protein
MPSRKRRRRRHSPDCSSAILTLVVIAAGVVVVVQAAVAWVMTHPLVIAVLMAMVGGGSWAAVAVPARAVRRRQLRAASVTDFLALSPGQFEEAIAGLCVRDGCRDVRVVGGAGDLAADVLATAPDGRRVLIQCKRYAIGRRVGSPEVQRVGGTYAIVHRADLAIVVTTASYTAEATGYARTAGIRLVDGDELAAWAAASRPPWA